MSIIENVKLGLIELRNHKLRSFLTTLGVIFGVGAVITMVAIGAGAKEKVLSQIKLLGTHNIRVRAVKLYGLDALDAQRKGVHGLTTDDVHKIAAILKDFITHIALAKNVNVKLYHENRILPATVLGVTADYPAIAGWRLASGNFIHPLADERAACVCVIGNKIKESMFPLKDAVGERIRLGRWLFSIVGVLEHQSVGSESAGTGVANPNNTVYIPLNVALKRILATGLNEQLDEIVIKVREECDLQEIANIVNNIMLRTHRGVKDFEIIIPEELMRQQMMTQRIFTQVMTAIALISLIVGGIGIMNIMLTTVTQRTREIGIRRAIGATKRDILAQFIVESIIISLAGGVLGIILGIAFAKGISLYAGWQTIISPVAIIISFFVAALTGLVFGLYPSVKAANLDPIEALRYE